jgi:hypothetical protein
MKIIPLKSALLTFGILFFGVENLSAHDDKVTVSQDAKFEQMLAEKRKINTSITVNDRYKIQIYNGDSETAKKTLIDFKKDFKNLDGTIVFSTPAYKVWVGNFRSRIEAERNLADLRKKFPNALMIKPNK